MGADPLPYLLARLRDWEWSTPRQATCDKLKTNFYYINLVFSHIRQNSYYTAALLGVKLGPLALWSWPLGPLALAPWLSHLGPLAFWSWLPGSLVWDPYSLALWLWVMHKMVQFIF
jgi:hypothetical protein